MGDAVKIQGWCNVTHFESFFSSLVQLIKKTAQMILQMISTFAKSFGFLSKMSNIKTPTTLIIAYIYGIEIDSRNLEPSFSLDKVDKVRIHLLNMQCKDKTNLY